jgi:RimJ/RimL family protein N-acetyltransferase
MQIISRRFLLRDFEPSDHAPFLAYHSDPSYLARYGKAEGEPGHAARLLEMFAAWANEEPRRNFQLAVVLRTGSQQLVGCAGLRRKGEDTAEFGIELDPAFWGRHRFALEVMETVLKFGFDDLALMAVLGVTTSGNTRAARLARWFGASARPLSALDSTDGQQPVEWRIDRGDWLAYCAR